jgi:glutamyl-tRNA synthetase
MDRYREVIALMLDKGLAYRCWASPEELDEMRESQREQGLKPRYDGRWRPEQSLGKSPPPNVSPVIRFRNPDDGSVVWKDMVKGTISIANSELDDLISIWALVMSFGETTTLTTRQGKSIFYAH